MRWIWRLFLLAFAIAVVLFAVANPEPVTIRLLPEDGPYGNLLVLRLPLFAVALACLFAGIVFGVVGEWLRGYSSRRRAARRGDSR